MMNKNSIISTIILGAIGSIIATVIVGLFTSESLKVFFELRVPIWILIAMIVFLVILSLVIALYFLKKPKFVFLMLSQSTNKQFVGSLVNDLIVELEFRNYEVILMPPLNFLSIESQHKWLDKISKNRLFFKGGFIIPQGDPKRKQVFLDFIDNFKKPIVFFDASPPFAIQDLRENNLFISYDNSKGGEIAAEAMIKEFKRRGISSYKVLVIGCNIVVDRQNSFREYFKKFNDTIEITVLNNGEFTRESGYRIFKQVLWDNGNNYKKYQGIFCTNDEMALGIIELINELKDFPREETVLIGYDATDEAISLINSNSSPFKNSVNQDSKKLAEICVENFINLRQKKYSNSKELLIEPRLYKSLEN